MVRDVLRHCLCSLWKITFSGKLTHCAGEGQSGEAPGVISWELSLSGQHQRSFNLQTSVVERHFLPCWKEAGCEEELAFALGEDPWEGWLWQGHSCHFWPVLVTVSVAVRAEAHRRLKPQSSWPKDSHWWQVSEMSCFVSGSFLFAADSTRLIPAPQEKQQSSARWCGSLATAFRKQRVRCRNCSAILWFGDNRVWCILHSRVLIYHCTESQKIIWEKLLIWMSRCFPTPTVVFFYLFFFSSPGKALSSETEKVHVTI